MKILPLLAIFAPQLTLALSRTAVSFEGRRTQSPSNKNKHLSPSVVHQTKGPWEERFQELLDFRQEHGHCRVPKRYAANKSLANWVSKQRQERRKYFQGKKASITPDRIKALEEVGFCWNAQQEVVNDEPIDAEETDFMAVWHNQWQSLAEYMSQNNLSSVGDLPIDTDHETWIKVQRKIYQASSGNSRKSLTHSQVELLNQLDPHWHLNRHQRVWEVRYQELLEYAQTHGNCCVPISHSNKKLAHWVSNQRKLYTEQLKGRRNALTEERKQRLEEIGFIWNRWEYEFERKHVAEGSFVET